MSKNIQSGFIFLQRVFRRAVTYKRPDSTRHTFASWSLAIGKLPPELVKLMGHVSKKMIYEEYGEWAKGLKDDINDITIFMSDDY